MINIGVVGIRGIGQGHIRRSGVLDDTRIAAVADTDELLLKECGEKYSIEKLYTNAEEMFNDPKIDGVILAVPNHLHAPMSISAMRKGKHVLIEKPMAENIENAKKMIKVRDETRKILMVGMNQRFSPEKAWIKKQIEKGMIGDIVYARAYWDKPILNFEKFKRGNWQYDKKQSGGGPLVDIGVHVIDLVMYLTGFPKVKSVYAYTSSGIGKEIARSYGIDYKIEDFISGIILFENGFALHTESSFFLNETEDIRNITLYGTKGKCGDSGLYIRKGINEFSTNSNFPNNKLESIPLGEAPSASSSVEHFSNVIMGKETLEATAEEGLLLLKIIEAMYKSAETGRSVEFVN